MKLFFKSSLIVASALLFSSAAFAQSPVCGEAQDDSWMTPEAMQQQVEALGYTVEALGVSEGNCYQVMGMNTEGNNVIAYFDPRTGGVVQEDVAQ